MTIQGTIASSVTRGIPGIPLQALDSITDENTRLVLQAIVDGWHVRNGSSGSGTGAFVTRAEIDGLVSAKTTKAVQQLGTMSLTPGMIARALDDLHTQVFESRLFKDLEARVDYIDKPGGIFDRLSASELALKDETNQRIQGDTGLSSQITALGVRIGSAEAALLTETQQRVNSDNALQTTLTTQYASVNDSIALVQQATTTNANRVAALTTSISQLQVQVDQNKAAIAQEATVRANADGDLFAQYTLRLDVNGYVTGFGLANSGTTSDFIVRADRFSIVNPNGNYAALILTNNTINVYDENGALRVRIGKLS